MYILIYHWYHPCFVGLPHFGCTDCAMDLRLRVLGWSLSHLGLNWNGEPTASSRTSGSQQGLPPIICNWITDQTERKESITKEKSYFKSDSNRTFHFMIYHSPSTNHLHMGLVRFHFCQKCTEFLPSSEAPEHRWDTARDHPQWPFEPSNNRCCTGVHDCSGVKYQLELTHTHTTRHTHTHAYVYIYIYYMYTYLRTCICVYTFIPTYIHIYIYVYIYTVTHICIYMYRYTLICIRTYIHTYIHT